MKQKNNSEPSQLNLFIRILGLVKPFFSLFVLTIFFNTIFSTLSTITIAIIKPIFQVLFKTPVQSGLNDTFKSGFFENLKNSFYEFIQVITFNPNDSVKTLINLSILIIILFIIKNIFKYIGSIFNVKLEEGIIKSIRDKIFSSITFLSLDFFNKSKQGDIISVITNDVAVLNSSTLSSLTTFLREIIQVFLFVILLISISPFLTLVAFSTSIISLLLVKYSLKFLRKYANRLQNTMANYTTLLQESITGIKIIKAFNLEFKVINKFLEQTANYVKSLVKYQKILTLIPAINEIMAILALSVVLLVGGKQVFEGTLGADDLMLFLFSLFAIMSPISTSINCLSQFQRGLVAGERVFKLIDQKPSVKDGLKKINSFNNKIEFKNVSFKYSDTDVIKNINLEINKGQKVALVGHSGSGKSTVIDLLVRFYDPTEGEILLDGINIKEFSLNSYRSIFGIVSQETILFNDTIGNNIKFGKETATFDEIINSAKVANAFSFISKLPRGFDTIIGDRGVLLSGGERQRIAIARALIRNPQIIIFDEATSSLDSESEKIVQEAINKSLENKTAIIVAHRLATIINCDKIYVFDEGKIVEQGTHNELIKLNGVYKKLFDIQFFSSQ